MKTRLAATCLGLALLGAPALATAAPVPPAAAAAPAAPATTPALPLPQDVQERQRRYAQREAQNPAAADFEGNGVGLYIGGSTLAVVLVIVLVVVLL
jgi:hypothetical protein